MRNLLDFLYRYRTFGLFIVLEVFCAWLIVQYNNRYNASFLNSSNVLVASVSEVAQNTENYFNLTEINKQLLEENERLKDSIISRPLIYSGNDSIQTRFNATKARVINNTYRRSMNFMTLDVGRNNGVEPGMGVISGTGVIGQIKSVSNHFSTVISLLHRNLMVSSTLKRTHTICTVSWDGLSPIQAEVRFVPKHIDLQVGDSVVTSDYNSVFPPGIMIGVVSEINVKDEDVYYGARIDLSTDFTSLTYAYVISDELKIEKDSLENLLPQ
ncbi:MAG: rod shape-determining protein MreC [Bacteroidota bacterium]